MFSLQDPGGKVIPMVTSVTQSGGKLYLGNLAYPFIGSFDMANLPESIMGASAEGQAT